MSPGVKNVAILMSVYEQDREEFLEEALESLVQQTFPLLDIHVAVDGPIRQPLTRVLASFQSRCARLFLHPHSLNRGLAPCLNDLIIELRNGYSYYARMDADDRSDPARIEKQVRFMEEYPGVDVLGGFIVEMNELGKPLNTIKLPLTHEEMVRFFRKRNPLAHPTVMFRPTYFEKAGLYPVVTRLEDLAYWKEGMKNGCRFANLPDVLVHVRRTDQFLRRRSGLRTAWREFKFKTHVNQELSFGILSHLYACGKLGTQLMPMRVRRFLYNHLR
jgi:glycosyltransferase involved in cell wall biosynthesis